MNINFELNDEKTFLENIQNEYFQEDDINIYNVIPYFEGDIENYNPDHIDGNVYLIAKNLTYNHGTIPIIATCLIRNDMSCELNTYNENICYILNQNISAINNDNAIWLNNMYGKFLWNKKMNLLFDFYNDNVLPEKCF